MERAQGCGESNAVSHVSSFPNLSALSEATPSSLQREEEHTRKQLTRERSQVTAAEGQSTSANIESDCQKRSFRQRNRASSRVTRSNSSDDPSKNHSSLTFCTAAVPDDDDDDDDDAPKNIKLRNAMSIRNLDGNQRDLPTHSKSSLRQVLTTADIEQIDTGKNSSGRDRTPSSRRLLAQNNSKFCDDVEASSKENIAQFPSGNFADPKHNPTKVDGGRPGLLRRSLSVRNFSGRETPSYRNLLARSSKIRDDDETCEPADVGYNNDRNHSPSCETSPRIDRRKAFRSAMSVRNIGLLSERNVLLKKSNSSIDGSDDYIPESTMDSGKEMKRISTGEDGKDVTDENGPSRGETQSRRKLFTSRGSFDDSNGTTTAAPQNRMKMLGRSLSVRNLRSNSTRELPSINMASVDEVKSARPSLDRGVSLNRSNSSIGSHDEMPKRTNSKNSRRDLMMRRCQSMAEGDREVESVPGKEETQSRRKLFKSRSSFDDSSGATTAPPNRMKMLGRSLSVRSLRSNSTREILSSTMASVGEEVMMAPPIQRKDSIRRLVVDEDEIEQPRVKTPMSDATASSLQLQLLSLLSVFVRHLLAGMQLLLVELRHSRVLRFLWVTLLDMVFFVVGKAFSLAVWVLAAVLNGVRVSSEWLINQRAVRKAFIVLLDRTKKPIHDHDVRGKKSD